MDCRFKFPALHNATCHAPFCSLMFASWSAPSSHLLTKQEIRRGNKDCHVMPSVHPFPSLTPQLVQGESPGFGGFEPPSLRPQVPWQGSQQTNERATGFNRNPAYPNAAFGRVGRGGGQRGRGSYGRGARGEDFRGQQGWGQQQQASKPFYEPQVGNLRPYAC